MPVVSYRGDLFFTSGAPRALAVGCNCAGAMHTGLAAQVRNRWPSMFEHYRERCVSGRLQPGDVFAWEDGFDCVVFCLAIRRHWRAPATLDAIELAVRAMLAEAERLAIGRIAMPPIGSGDDAIEWPAVHAVLEAEAGQHPVTLMVVRRHEPNRRLRRIRSESPSTAPANNKERTRTRVPKTVPSAPGDCDARAPAESSSHENERSHR